jgi:DNA-3-methyladenine glycosylase
MQEHTNKVGKNKPAQIRTLLAGPGRCGRALDIGMEYTTYDFCAEGNDDAYVEEEIGYEVEDEQIEETYRVNIDYAEEYRFKKWRFFLKGNKCVSKKVQTREQLIEQTKKKAYKNK